MIWRLAAAFPPGLWDGVTRDGNGNVAPSSAQDILVVVANAIRIATAFAGALAVIFIVLGGLYYVISAGNPANIKRAKDIITNSVVGFVIASLAYIIVTFVAGRF